MYLSRLSLNTRSRQARQDLGNPYEFHRTFARVMGCEHPGLYRVEDRTVLVQTRQQPDWSQLEADYLSIPAETRELDLERHLSVPGPLRFRLTAQPCVSKLVGHRSRDGKRQTRRFPLTAIEDQLEWLKRQGTRCGYEVVGAMVSDCGYLELYKTNEKRRVSIYRATFDGHLRATDAEKLKGFIETGVGHGKAWGLGLLSI